MRELYLEFSNKISGLLANTRHDKNEAEKGMKLDLLFFAENGWAIWLKFQGKLRQITQ
jgi:hypothetical protein